MMQRFVLAIVFMLLPVNVIASSHSVYLIAIRIQPSSNASHISFILSGKTHQQVKYLPHAHQLIVEMANTRRHFAIDHLNLKDANIDSFSTQETANTLRFIFFINGPIQWKIQYSPQHTKTVAHLELHVLSTNMSAIVKEIPIKTSNFSQLQTNFQKELLHMLADDASHKLKEALKPSPFVGRSRLPESSTNASANKTKIFTVVIDAGHGGSDPGAKGSQGTEEKQVVLAIARQLAKEINAQPNLHAILTRRYDYFVPLRERLRLARKGKADLFIAIHADAYFNNNARGASVYALSKHGATSEAARWLAKRDNYSELGGIELATLKDRSPQLRSVLIDLAQTMTIHDSVRLGNKVLDALDDVSPLHYTHVEQAPFVVLKSPDIPSILVETGFITNTYEEKRLADPAHQAAIAHALSLGIQAYIKQYAVWQ